MTPMLLKDVFEEQIGGAMDATFIESLTRCTGRRSAGLLGYF
jgi:hypothetical protein